MLFSFHFISFLFYFILRNSGDGWPLLFPGVRFPLRRRSTFAASWEQESNRYLSHNVHQSDVIAAWSGLRPLVRDPKLMGEEGTKVSDGERGRIGARPGFRVLASKLAGR